jgi:nicotinamidase/pyrazinamidase
MKTLVIIDLQNDFCPGGALAVKEGDAIIPLINTLQKEFDLVVATQDWHPQNHLSFASNHQDKKPGDTIILEGIQQTLWPDHCVQKTKGAEFAKALNLNNIDRFFQKGTDKRIDSYSGFFDNEHKKSTGLADYLKEKEAKQIYIAGLATDYCVKYTVLDALQLGFDITVIEDACRGINLNEGDIRSSFNEMQEAGANIVTSGDFL